MTEPTAAADDAIAVVGMAGRFASARNVDELWGALRNGRELITHYDRDDLMGRGVHPDLVAHPDYVASRGALAEPLGFDAPFFGYSAREAQLMDPQQRLLLETAWHVAEDAGLPPAAIPGRVGVFAAVAPPTYVAAYPPPRGVDPLEIQLGNDTDFAASRVSYKLGLDGPSVAVSTACSSGLTAVHLACQSLISGDSDASFALAASVRMPADRGLLRLSGSILSGDGHCRPFAANADGTVEADGAAGLLLRRLDDALAAGDRIYAVIVGSAIGNDGSDRIGFTAPGVQGQRTILESALRYADVDAADVAYVEAHGTGTRLGDPIETRALAAVYGVAHRAEACRFGSLKSNLGHLNHVAGIAGLIKVALSLERGELVPSLHLDHGLNPELDLAGGRLRVQSRLEAWPGGYAQRIAAVSSFGMGGSGAHVVLTAAPEMQRPAKPATSTAAILPLSARSPEALAAASTELADWLASHPAADLQDVAHTLREGRTALPYRTAVVGSERNDVIAALAASPIPRQPVPAEGRTVLIFPGQGAEQPGMAATLYDADGSFRRHLEDCLDCLPGQDRAEVRSYLLDAKNGGSGTRLAQPALFAMEYAKARCWEAAGLEVTGMIGHSVGEFAAACLSGVFSAENAMRLVAARGRLSAGTGPGAMLAVRLAPAQLHDRLAHFHGWDLAAHNADDECVLAGDESAIDAIADALRADGVGTMPVEVAHAFHSHRLDPILAEFAAAVGDVERCAPSRPFISCVTGTWVTAEQVVSVDHWVRHLRGTVRFADGLQSALAAGTSTFVQLGPGRMAASYVRRAGSEAIVVIGDDHLPLQGVALAWSGGATVRRSTGGRRIALPGYPFQRRTYVHSTAAAPGPRVARLSPGDWFHAETFGPDAPALISAADAADLLPRRCHVDGSGPIAEALRVYVRAHGLELVSATDDLPATLTFMVIERDGDPLAGDVEAQLDPLRRAGGSVTGDLVVVTAASSHSGASDAGALQQSAWGAAAEATARVVSQEHPGLRVRGVDVAPGQDPGLVASRVALAAVDERTEATILYDGRHWVRRLDRVTVSGPSALRRNGTYLLVGGTGPVGLELATWLVTEHVANVAILGRRDLAQLPPHVVSKLAGLGERASYFPADVTVLDSLTCAWDAVVAAFGPIHGVVHAAGETTTASPVPGPWAAVGDLHMPAKGIGTDQLAAVVAARKPSFVLGLSCLSVLLGGEGLAGHAAANAYLESSFARLNRRSPTVWAALRLDGWEAQRTESSTGSALTAADAPALFDRAFRLLPLGTSTVSVTPLRGRMADSEPRSACAPAESFAHPRPPMAAPYRPAVSKLEATIISHLEGLLNTEGIGVDDDFFDLGWNSLLATSLASRLAAHFEIDVNPHIVFDASTAAQLATALRTLNQESDHPR